MFPLKDGDAAASSSIVKRTKTDEPACDEPAIVPTGGETTMTPAGDETPMKPAGDETTMEPAPKGISLEAALEEIMDDELNDDGGSKSPEKDVVPATKLQDDVIDQLSKQAIQHPQFQHFVKWTMTTNGFDAGDGDIWQFGECDVWEDLVSMQQWLTTSGHELLDVDLMKVAESIIHVDAKKCDDASVRAKDTKKGATIADDDMTVTVKDTEEHHVLPSKPPVTIEDHAEPNHAGPGKTGDTEKTKDNPFHVFASGSSISLGAVVDAARRCASNCTAGQEWKQTVHSFIGNQKEEIVSSLVQECRNHPLFDEHCADVISSAGVDGNEWLFGSVEGDPLEDLVDMVCWLVGKTNSDQDGLDKTEKPKESHTAAARFRWNHDEGEHDDDQFLASDSDGTEGESRIDFTYPLAPTADHPNIKCILKSASKAGGKKIIKT